MSLLNSILGGLMGGQAQQSPVAGILTSLLSLALHVRGVGRRRAAGG